MLRYVPLLFLFAVLFLSCERIETPVSRFFLVDFRPRNGAENVDKFAPFIIEFSQPVFARDIMEHVQVFDVTHQKNVAISLRANNNMPPVYHIPTEPSEKWYIEHGWLQRNSHIQVTIDGELTSAAGIPLDRDYQIHFVTREDSLPLYLKSVFPPPGKGISRNLRSIYFDFSDPIFPLQEWITVEPAEPPFSIGQISIVYQKEKEDPPFPPVSTFFIYWTDSLLADTTYTITLSRSITDYEGDSLGQDIVLKYRVFD